MADEKTSDSLSAQDLQLWIGFFTAALHGSVTLIGSSTDRPAGPEAIATYCAKVADEAFKELQRRRGEPEYQAFWLNR